MIMGTVFRGWFIQSKTVAAQYSWYELEANTGWRPAISLMKNPIAVNSA